MAKNKAVRLGSTTAKKSVSSSIIRLDGVLPAYTRYLDLPAKGDNPAYRIWFETPGVGEYKMAHGQKSIGTKVSLLEAGEKSGLHGLAKELAQCLTTIDYKHSSAMNIYQTALRLIEFCSSRPNINKITDITEIDVLDFHQKFPSHKKRLISIFKHHPHGKSLAIRNLRIPKKNRVDILKDDLDQLLESKDYSDRMMMQIVVYTLYDIEVYMQRWEKLQSVSIESLIEKGIYISPQDIENGGHLDVFARLPQEDAIDAIQQNLILACQQFVTRAECSIAPSVLLRKFHTVFQNKRNIYNSAISQLKNELHLPDSHKFVGELTFSTQQFTFTVLLYLLIISGVNKRVGMTLERHYGSTSWQNNYDIELGVNENTNEHNRTIKIIGTKSLSIGGSKSVAIKVPVRSHLYRVLHFFDSVSGQATERKYLFNLSNFIQNSEIFCQKYPIEGDDGDLLTLIDSTRLRKTYAL